MMNIMNNVKAIYHLRKVNHAVDKMDKYRHDDQAKFENQSYFIKLERRHASAFPFFFSRVFYIFYYEKD